MASLQELKIRLTVENGQVRGALRNVNADLGQLVQTAARGGAAAASNLEQVTRSVQGMEEGFSKLQSIAATAISFGALKAGITSLTSAYLQFEQIKNTLFAATGSEQAGAAELNFLEETAKRVGVRFLEVGEIYAGYVAAAKQAGLATAEIRDLFSSTAEAGAVFNLSAQQMGSAMVALQQMMGMGVIRSQELRMQLGSALPGVYPAFAATLKKMGLDLNQMLEKGELDVKRFAPVLREAIQSMYSPEDVARASNDLNSQLAKLSNSIQFLKVNLASGDFANFFGEVIAIAGDLINALDRILQGIGPIGVAITAAALAFGVFAKAANLAVSTVTAGIRATMQDALAKKAAAAAALEDARASQALSAAKVQEANARRATMRVAMLEAVAASEEAKLNVIRAQASLQLAQQKAAGAAGSARLAAAEQALAVATTRAAAAQQAQNVAIAQYRVAAGAATVATRAHTAAQGTAAVATGTLGARMVTAGRAATVLTGIGRGFLAMLGGWPGIVIAAAFALVTLATRASEAERATRDLHNELEGGIQKIKDYTAAINSYAGYTVQLQTATARYNTLLKDTNATEEQRASALAEVARLTGKTEQAQKGLADAYDGQRSEMDRVRQSLNTLRTEHSKAASEMRSAQIAFNAIPSTEGQRSEVVDGIRVMSEGTLRWTQAKKALTAAENKELEVRKQLNDTTRALNAHTNTLTNAGRSGAAAARNVANATTLQGLSEKRLAAETGLSSEQMERKTKAMGLAERQTTALAAASKDLARLSATDRKKAEEDIRATVKAQFELEKLQEKQKAPKKVKDTSEKDARELARAIKEANDNVRQMENSALDLDFQLMHLDDTTRTYVERIRQMQTQYDNAVEVINELKIPEAEREAALERLTLAAENAGRAIAQLRIEEERRLQVLLVEQQAQALYDSDLADAQQNGNPLVIARAEAEAARREAENRRLEAEVAAEEAYGRETEQFRIAMERADTIYAAAMARIQTSFERTTATLKGIGQAIGQWMIDNLGSNIEMALRGNFKGIVDAWKDMLIRMIAEFIKMRILEWIDKLIKRLRDARKEAQAANSSSGGASGGSGWMGAIANFIVGLFSKGKANGGFMDGPGSSTSDSIPVRVSKGEYVVRAAAVQRYGRDFFEALNRMTMPRFAGGGFIGSGGGGGMGDAVQVNIYNSTGEQVQTRRRQNGSREELDVFIGEVAKSVREGGLVGQAVQQTYGVGRRGVGRK